MSTFCPSRIALEAISAPPSVLPDRRPVQTTLRLAALVAISAWILWSFGNSILIVATGGVFALNDDSQGVVRIARVFITHGIPIPSRVMRFHEKDQ